MLILKNDVIEEVESEDDEQEDLDDSNNLNDF
jgi:hypothetical protein